MLDCSFAYAGCSAAICYAVSFVALQKKSGKACSSRSYLVYLHRDLNISQPRFEHFAAVI